MKVATMERLFFKHDRVRVKDPMGWFFLNAKDYAWFKANLKEVEATSGK